MRGKVWKDLILLGLREILILQDKRIIITFDKEKLLLVYLTEYYIYIIYIFLYQNNFSTFV